MNYGVLVLTKKTKWWLLLTLLCPLWVNADAIAPDFTLPTHDGTEITLSHLKGKVVYLDFWASWCGPCRQSFPWLNELRAKNSPEDLQIIAVNLDSDQALAKKFLSKLPANFTVAYDPKGTVAEAYQLPGMPTSFLIDRNGLVVSRHIGFLKQDSEKLAQQIQYLLQQ
jgi:cytochrome c biogenesis protein CcmG/thiol:disulfide interchange protein DsbE